MAPLRYAFPLFALLATSACDSDEHANVDSGRGAVEAGPAGCMLPDEVSLVADPGTVRVDDKGLHAEASLDAGDLAKLVVMGEPYCVECARNEADFPHVFDADFFSMFIVVFSADPANAAPEHVLVVDKEQGSLVLTEPLADGTVSLEGADLRFHEVAVKPASGVSRPDISVVFDNSGVQTFRQFDIRGDVRGGCDLTVKSFKASSL